MGIVGRLRARLASRPAAAPAEDGLKESVGSYEQLAALADRCPAVSEFGAEAGSVLAVDTNEGCRVTVSRSRPAAGGEMAATYTLNLGTYAAMGSQAEMVRALLSPGGGRAAAPRGGSQWDLILRHATRDGGRIAQLRLNDRGSAEFNGRYQPADAVIAKTTVVTHDLPDLANTGRSLLRSAISKTPLGRGFGDLPPTGAARNTTAIVTLEHANEHRNLSASILSHDDAVYYGTGWVSRIGKRLWSGVDMTLLSPPNTVIMNHGLRYRSEDASALASAVVNISPDFSKPVNEGFDARIYALKLSALKRLNDRLTVASDLEVPISRPSDGNRLTNTVARIGYECRYPETCITARVGTDLKVEQKIIDASGLHMSGTLDFLNSDYKVGFGYDLAIE